MLLRHKVELVDLRGKELLDGFFKLPPNFTSVVVEDKNGFVLTANYIQIGSTPYDNARILEALTYIGEDDVTIRLDYTADCPFPEYITDALEREEGCSVEHIMHGSLTRKRIFDAWLNDCGLGGATAKIIEGIADIYGIRLTDNGFEMVGPERRREG